MSSTNRGGQRSEADNYPTPPWATHRLIESFLPVGKRWVEPAAGNGAIIKAINQTNPDIEWTAIELREEAGAELKAQPGIKNVIVQDFLSLEVTPENHWDVAITNPPYSIAQLFIEKSLKHADCVIMLLRLNFMGADCRVDLWPRIGVPDVYVLPNRPDFSGTGGDSCEYGWMVWHANQPGKLQKSHGRLEVLDVTSKEIRKAQKPVGAKRPNKKQREEKKAAKEDSGIMTAPEVVAERKAE